jgi:hypothetical protein
VTESRHPHGARQGDCDERSTRPRLRSPGQEGHARHCRQHAHDTDCRIEPGRGGEGIVLDSRIQDDDEIVDVVFESVGIKRLSASLANLKII